MAGKPLVEVVVLECYGERVLWWKSLITVYTEIISRDEVCNEIKGAVHVYFLGRYLQYTRLVTSISVKVKREEVPVC